MIYKSKRILQLGETQRVWLDLLWKISPFLIKRLIKSIIVIYCAFMYKENSLYHLKLRLKQHYSLKWIKGTKRVVKSKQIHLRPHLHTFYLL